jgi:hypothetical protein
MRLADLFPLARDSIADPRATFRRLQALDLDRATLWQALIAVSVVSVMLFLAGQHLVVMQGGRPLFPGGLGAVYLSLVFFAGQALIAVFVYWGGRMLGGTGSFEGALLAVVWLDFITACVLVVQLVLQVLLPPLAGLVGLAGFVLSFWLLTGFIVQLHGFRSMARTFVGILIGLVGLFVVMLVLSTIIVLMMPEPPDV